MNNRMGLNYFIKTEKITSFITFLDIVQKAILLKNLSKRSPILSNFSQTAMLGHSSINIFECRRVSLKRTTAGAARSGGLIDGIHLDVVIN